MADKKTEKLFHKALTAVKQSRAHGATLSNVSRSEQQYLQRERALAHKQAQQAKKLPLSERKANQAEYLEAMREDPKRVAQTIEYILAGHYGRGPYEIGWDIMRSPRMNQQAALGQMAALHEWGVPDDMARAAWKKLTPPEKKRLSSLIQKEIEDARE